jgi:hypothetical protein
VTGSIQFRAHRTLERRLPVISMEALPS